jgi:carbonic anhydrase
MMAICASTPALFSSFIATFITAERSVTAVGTVLGSVVFNHTCIISGCILASPGCLMHIPIVDSFRDLFFFAVAIIGFIIAVADDKVTAIESWCLFGVYVLYLIACVSWGRVELFMRRLFKDAHGFSHDTASLDTFHPLKEITVSHDTTPIDTFHPLKETLTALPKLESQNNMNSAQSTMSRSMSRDWLIDLEVFDHSFERLPSRLTNVGVMHSFRPESLAKALSNADPIKNEAVSSRLTSFHSSMANTAYHQAAQEHEHVQPGPVTSSHVSFDSVLALFANLGKARSDAKKQHGDSWTKPHTHALLNADVDDSGFEVMGGRQGLEIDRLAGRKGIELDRRVWSSKIFRNPYEEACYVWNEGSSYTKVSFLLEFFWMVMAWLSLSWFRDKGWFSTGVVVGVGWIIVQNIYLTYWLEKSACIIGITTGAMGTIFGAAGRSIPNFFCALYVARQGKSVLAAGTVWGSQVWLLSVCLGLPWAIYSTTTGKSVTVQGSTLLSLWMGLFYLFFIVLCMVSKWRLNRWHGYFSLFVYLCFSVFVYCSTIKTTFAENIFQGPKGAPASLFEQEQVQKYYEVVGPVDAGGQGNCHWTHKEAMHWGSICQGKYPTCSMGKSQSPIDIKTGDLIVLPTSQTIGWNIPDKSFEEYAHFVKGRGAESAVESYNGHTFEVAHINATFTYNDVDYTLKGFHMHTLSEHTFDGEHTSLEIHFVHTTRNVSADSKVLVVAAFFKAADGHGSPSFIRQLVEASANLNDVPKTVVPVDFAEVAQTVMIGSLEHRGSGSNVAFIPNFRNYIVYKGSFTTPPCTEGVQWILLRNPVYIYEDDAKALSELMGDNFRPVLPLNGRFVTTSV